MGEATLGNVVRESLSRGSRGYLNDEKRHGKMGIDCSR